MTDARAQIAAQTAKQKAPVAYRFPGTEVPIAIQLLGEDEIDRGRVDAMTYSKKAKQDLDVDPDFFETECRRQVIWRAVLEPVADAKGVHPRLYPSDSDVRALDSATFDALFRLYLEHQETKSVTRQYTEEQIDDLVVRVRTNPKRAADEFSQTPHEVLVRILISLAAKPPT